MSDSSDPHVPTPEFLASLEHDIVHAWRRQSQFEPPRRRSTYGRARSAVMLVIGLLLGTGAGLASAQVSNARQRDELSAAVEVKRQLAMAKLEMAQANLASVQRAFDAGARGRDALNAAELEVRMAEAELQRINLDLEEIRLTAAAPRDELTAPLVNGRNFVKERLVLEAALAGRRVSALRDAAADVERRVRSGASSELALLEAQDEELQAESEMRLIGQKLLLRQQFLEKHVKPDVTLLPLHQLMADIDRATRQVKLSKQRAALVQQRKEAGVAGELEMKQAEVEVLQRSLELSQLTLQLQRLSLDSRRKKN